MQNILEMSRATDFSSGIMAIGFDKARQAAGSQRQRKKTEEKNPSANTTSVAKRFCKQEAGRFEDNSGKHRRTQTTLKKNLFSHACFFFFHFFLLRDTVRP